MRQCARCESRGFKRGSTKLQRVIDCFAFESTLPANVCKGCGEAHVDADALGRFKLCGAPELARTGPGTPTAFKFMRMTLGLSGVALGELLGVEPETISRWENGARGLDRGAIALLGGLVMERLEDRSDRHSRGTRSAQPAVQEAEDGGESARGVSKETS